MTAAPAITLKRPRRSRQLRPVRFLKIEDVTAFEQLIDGEWLHDKDGAYWHPYCIEAYRAIMKAVATSLKNQRGALRKQNSEELVAEVRGRLAVCQNPNFFSSPNRVGWVAQFAYNVGRDWLRKRIRTGKRDERVRERIEKGIIPPDSIGEKVDDETPKFDPYQFAGRRPKIRFDSEASVPMLPEDLMTHSEPTTETPYGDLISRVNNMLQMLPEDDQRFFWEYFDSRHDYAHSDRDRQRFRRLCKKIRQGVSQTPLR